MFLATPPPPPPRTPNSLKGDLLVYWSTVWSEEFLSPHSAEAPTEEEVSHDQNTTKCLCLFPPCSQHKEKRLPPQAKPQSVLPNSFCLFNASLMRSTSPQILPLSWTKKGWTIRSWTPRVDTSLLGPHLETYMRCPPPLSPQFGIRPLSGPSSIEIEINEPTPLTG